MNLSSYPGSVLHPRFGTQILDSTNIRLESGLRGQVRCLKLQKLISMMSGNRSKNQRTLNDSDCTSDRQNGAPCINYLHVRPNQTTMVATMFLSRDQWTIMSPNIPEKCFFFKFYYLYFIKHVEK